MKISCHLSFAAQHPKPAASAGGGKYRCLVPIDLIWLPWSHKIQNPNYEAPVVL